jgi:hypothetical protein
MMRSAAGWPAITAKTNHKIGRRTGKCRAVKCEKQLRNHNKNQARPVKPCRKLPDRPAEERRNAHENHGA